MSMKQFLWNGSTKVIFNSRVNTCLGGCSWSQFFSIGYFGGMDGVSVVCAIVVIFVGNCVVVVVV